MTPSCSHPGHKIDETGGRVGLVVFCHGCGIASRLTAKEVAELPDLITPGDWVRLFRGERDFTTLEVLFPHTHKLIRNTE